MKNRNRKEDFNFDEILKRAEGIIANHPRKDVEYRINIVLSQLGDVCRYITHDKKLMPGVHPYGTKKDEEDAFGHTLAQLLVAAQIRGIDAKKAILGAMDGMEEKEWQERKGKNEESHLEGIVAHSGKVSGIAFVDHHGRKLHKLDGHILVIENVRPDIIIHLKKVKGIITNHGGKFSHAATLARELDIPCVVGTGNATEIINHGQKIRIEADSKNGRVHLSIK